jgi:hypothetical protein
VAGAGAQSYNSAGAGDEKPEFAQHYIILHTAANQPFEILTHTYYNIFYPVMKRHGHACGSQAVERKRTVTIATHIKLVLLNHLG